MPIQWIGNCQLARDTYVLAAAAQIMTGQASNSDARSWPLSNGQRDPAQWLVKFQSGHTDRPLTAAYWVPLKDR